MNANSTPQPSPNLDYAKTYAPLPAVANRAATALRMGGALTLIGSLTLGLILMVMTWNEFPLEVILFSVTLLFGPPTAVGCIYIVCARRIDSGRRAPAYLALVLASLHVGVSLFSALLAARAMLRWIWDSTPRMTGWTIDSEPYGALSWTLLLIGLVFAPIMTLIILHLLAFLRSGGIREAQRAK